MSPMSKKQNNEVATFAVACWMGLVASCAQTPAVTDPVQADAESVTSESMESSKEAALAQTVALAAAPVVEPAMEPAMEPKTQPAVMLNPEPEPLKAATVPASAPAQPKPKSPASRVRRGAVDDSLLGTAYFKTPEFKRRFADSFLSVSDVEPSVSQDEVEELQEIIELIQQEGKRERALKKLQSAINETSSANYPYLIAQIHQAEERYELALEGYLDAVDRTPTFRRAWQQIALLHYRRAIEEGNEDPSSNYRDCAKAFAKAISLGLVDETSYGMMAVALLNSGRILAAETAFRQAIMMGPDEKQWAMGLAQSYFKSKRYGDAVALLDDMIVDQPDSASLWMLQGNAYLGLQEPERAARNFSVVDQLGAGTNGSTNVLADIYANGGLFTEAVPVYLKALTLDEGATPERSIRAARMMTGRGNVEAATNLLAGVEAHFGEDLPGEAATEILKLRAKIAVREGRGSDEIAVLRQIVDRDPLDGDGMILLADALARNGKIDEALQYFETASTIEAFEAEAKLQHARILVQQKRFAEAVPLLKSSLQINDKESVRAYLANVEKAARRSTN